MKENSKEIYNKIRYSLKHFDKSQKMLKKDELFKLYDSAINTPPIKKSLNYKVNSFNYNSNSMSMTNHCKNKNLIDSIINYKVNSYRKGLYNHYNEIKPMMQNQKEEKIPQKIDSGVNKTFITNANIKSRNNKNSENEKEDNQEDKKEEKDTSMGKSLNDILIKNINDEMINKGILVQRSVSSKHNNKSANLLGNNNFNNYEMHMKYFDQKMKKEFYNYIYEYELAQKKTLRSVSQKLADRRDKIFKKIPIYIKGYKKDPLDIFHQRNVFDLDYQRYYSKPCVNIDEILHNQNKTGEYKFKKRKTPFYCFYRTVKNPKLKKFNPASNHIRIECNW